MTQTIEQLIAELRELEEENARLMADNIAFARNLKGKSATTGATYEHICTQLAASQLHAEQLREALESCYEKMKQMCLNGEWYAPDKAIDLAYAALAIPHDTSALDAYVAAKVKEKTDALHYRMEHCYSIDHVKIQCELDKITKQRDLAVEALGKLRGMAPADDVLQAIKESEEN